jgi:predicted dithiol-disulfide oxidoreductase (DUF899 family)
MSLPRLVSRDEWLAARKQLLANEKEMTRQRDALNAERRRLPMVEIDKDYPWYSSYGSDFNYDFHVTLDESVAPMEYNYRTAVEYKQADASVTLAGEQPGQSCFLRDGDRVFHTYSSYARGAEMTGGSYYYLDLTALGRQEDWEEPKGRAASAHAAQPDFAD